MVKGRRITASMPLIALTGTCAAVGVLAATLFRPEAVLDRGVEAALADLTAPSEPPARPAPRQALADSPDFRLSSLDGMHPLALSGPLQVGDRIDITGRNGRRTLEVVEIHPISPGLTKVEHAPATRFLLVTIREVGSTDARLLRIIIEAEELPQVGIGEPQRTL